MRNVDQLQKEVRHKLFWVSDLEVLHGEYSKVHSQEQTLVDCRVLTLTSNISIMTGQMPDMVFIVHRPFP